MSQPHDQALVDELRILIGRAFVVDPTGATSARAVLDRLTELGRLEPMAPKPGGLWQPALGQKCLCGRDAYASCAECGEMTADCYCETTTPSSEGQ